MSKVQPATATAPAPPPGPRPGPQGGMPGPWLTAGDWTVRTLNAYVMAKQGNVTLTVELAAPHGERVQQEALDQFRALTGPEALHKLPAAAAARKARQELTAAEARRAELQAELARLEADPIDLAGDLSGRARREGTLRDQLALFDRRLPALTAACDEARTALLRDARAALSQQRIAALTAVEQQKKQLLAEWIDAADEALRRLLVLDELGRNLAPDHSEHAARQLVDGVCPPPPPTPPALNLLAGPPLPPGAPRGGF